MLQLSVVNGEAVSQLSSTLSVGANDLFIVNRPKDSSGNESHIDFKMTYDQLSSRLLHDISARFGFKSMAFRDVWQYAKVNHKHDYNKVKAYANYSYEDVIDMYSPTNKIVTYNIQHGEGTDNNIDLNRTINNIFKQKANIVCLQEVDNGTTRSGNINQAEQIKNGLGYRKWNYIFSKAINYNNGQYGLGILYSNEKKLLHNYEYDLPFIEDDQNRIMQICEFEDIVVVNTHLAERGQLTEKKTQIEFIFKTIESYYFNKPIFLVGDFNIQPSDSSIYDYICTKFTALNDITAITASNNRIIDYIFVNNEYIDFCYKNKTYVYDDLVASCHKPVYVENLCKKPHDLDEWLGTMSISVLSVVNVLNEDGTIFYDEFHQSYTEEKIIEVSTDFFVPHIEFPKYNDIEVGEARFITKAKSVENITTPTDFTSLTSMIYDEEYDGYWVYACGQTYSCQSYEFIDACKVYGNNGKNGDDLSFTVPCLSNFIKLNPRTYLSDPMKKIWYQTGLSSHTHTINKNFDGTELELSVPVVIPTSKTNGRENLPHEGAGQIDNTVHEISCENIPFKSNTNPGNLQYFGTNRYEVYPTHVELPLLIYIGQR